MEYQEIKNQIVAGKFIVIKDFIVDMICGPFASLNTGKTAYGIFKMDNYHVTGDTSFKTVLEPMIQGFMKHAWYTSDISSMMMNNPDYQIFDNFEDAECYHYVLTHTGSRVSSSWIKKFFNQIKFYWKVLKNS